MLNYIWFGMMAIAVVVGTFTGRIEAVTDAAIDMARTAVTIAIGLVGIMALWLGIMKIAEESGLIRIIAKLLKPVTIRLFPDVPADHPAMGSIVLNMAANMMGLGNAATPLGLKAMEELQELNPKKDTAQGNRQQRDGDVPCHQYLQRADHPARHRRGPDGRGVQPDFHPYHPGHAVLDHCGHRRGQGSGEAEAVRPAG